MMADPEGSMPNIYALVTVLPSENSVGSIAIATKACFEADNDSKAHTLAEGAALTSIPLPIQDRIEVNKEEVETSLEPDAKADFAEGTCPAFEDIAPADLSLPLQRNVMMSSLESNKMLTQSSVTTKVPTDVATSLAGSTLSTIQYVEPEPDSLAQASTLELSTAAEGTNKGSK